MKASAQALYNGVFTGLSAVVSGISVYILEETSEPLPKDETLRDEILISRNGEYLKYVAYISITAFFVFLIKNVIVDELVSKMRKGRRSKCDSDDSGIPMSVKFTSVKDKQDDE